MNRYPTELFSAKEQIDKLHHEVNEYRKHVGIVMKREAELKKRIAQLEAMPVLTREEVESRWKEFVQLGKWNSFYSWLLSRLPARLEPVAVTEEEIAEALAETCPHSGREDWFEEARAVLALLREKQLVKSEEAQEEAGMARMGFTPIDDAVEVQWAEEKARLEKMLREAQDAEHVFVAREVKVVALEEERDSLREEIERLEQDCKKQEEWADKYLAERDSLRQQLAEAEKTRTVRPKVRFECEAGTVIRVPNGPVIEDYIIIQEVLDYLSTRAVIEVPEGVPSAEDLVNIVRLGEQQIVVRAKKDGTWPFEKLAYESYKKVAQLILDRLSPYLQPQASVDPKLCETPIATAETLEQLAEIGWNKDREEFNRLYGSVNYRVVDWKNADDIDKKSFRVSVAAILRAARPEAWVTRKKLAEWVNSRMSNEAVYEQINSRIRYCVEVPPAECKQGWREWDTAPSDGSEILVRFKHQGNVVRLCRFNIVHGYWESKGVPVLGLCNQGCQWHHVPGVKYPACEEVRKLTGGA